jgi:hypothetical protein
MTKTITVQAAANLDSLDNDGAAIVMEFDTVKDARKHAQYYTSEAFRVASESSERLGYARVLVNGECVNDYFAL